MSYIYSLDETIEALNNFEFVEGFQETFNRRSMLGYEDNKKNISLDVWSPRSSRHGGALGEENDRFKTPMEVSSELNWLDDNYTIVNIFEESEESDKLKFRVQLSQRDKDIFYKAPADKSKTDISEEKIIEWRYPV